MPTKQINPSKQKEVEEKIKALNGSRPYKPRKKVEEEIIIVDPDYDSYDEESDDNNIEDKSSCEEEDLQAPPTKNPKIAKKGAKKKVNSNKEDELQLVLEQFKALAEDHNALKNEVKMKNQEKEKKKPEKEKRKQETEDIIREVYEDLATRRKRKEIGTTLLREKSKINAINI